MLVSAMLNRTSNPFPVVSFIIKFSVLSFLLSTLMPNIALAELKLILGDDR